MGANRLRRAADRTRRSLQLGLLDELVTGELQLMIESTKIATWPDKITVTLRALSRDGTERHRATSEASR